MEVMLPTAVGGGLVLAAAITYGLRQPAAKAAALGGGVAPIPSTPTHGGSDDVVGDLVGGADVNDGRADINAFVAGDLAAARAKANLPLRLLVKRAMDIFFAIALLIVTAPVLLLVSALIAIDSPGPIFYRQVRLGAGGRPFEIIKFRSMRTDAESNGAQWAKVGDARVTRMGRIIRYLRIDEIPQAFNVLSGDMSFVGPRPERPEFVEVLERAIPHYDARHIVKPGITGWAQVKCSYGASVEDAREKHRFDLFYLKNYSLLRDIMIVFMTVRVALFGLGSR